MAIVLIPFTYPIRDSSNTRRPRFAFFRWPRATLRNSLTHLHLTILHLFIPNNNPDRFSESGIIDKLFVGVDQQCAHDGCQTLEQCLPVPAGAGAKSLYSLPT